MWFPEGKRIKINQRLPPFLVYLFISSKPHTHAQFPYTSIKKLHHTVDNTYVQTMMPVIVQMAYLCLRFSLPSQHNLLTTPHTLSIKFTPYLENSSSYFMVPPEVTTITTPLHPCEWQKLLCEHPGKPLMVYFICALWNGIRVDFKNPHIITWQKPSNLSRWWMIISMQRLPNIMLLAPSAKQASRIPTLADLRSSLNTTNPTNGDWLWIFPTWQTLVLKTESEKKYAVSLTSQWTLQLTT